VGRLRFLFDEHVAEAVAQGLRRRGVDVLTAAEASLLGAPDTLYMARSRSDQFVIVTHDRDFLRLDERGEDHAGIAYCDQGRRSIGEMVSRLILLHETVE